MEYDNPAARLESLLLVGRKEPRTAICRNVWKSILNVEGDSQLMLALGQLMGLPVLAIETIRESYSEDIVTANSFWVQKVNEAFFKQQLNGHWSSFIDSIDDHTLNYLKMSSMLISNKSNTQIIASENLKELRVQFGQIVEDLINDTNIDIDVKKYLIRHIKKIIDGIDSYQITGAIPLLDNFDTIVGHAARDSNYRIFLKDHAIGQRTIDILSVMASLVTVATGLPQLSLVLAQIGFSR